jgi:hypothetical protein
MMSNVTGTPRSIVPAEVSSVSDLGAIIPTVKGRVLAYGIFAAVSLVVGNTAVAYASIQTPFPAWLIIAVAVGNNLAVPFAALAVANAKNTNA